MNMETGEIKELSLLSIKESLSGKWLPLDEKQNSLLSGMNRSQRRKWAKDHGRINKGVWGWR